MLAFTDESTDGVYVMAVATVRPGDVDTARKTLRGLLQPRQRALHCRREDDAQRHRIVRAVTGLPVDVWVMSRKDTDQLGARLTILDRMVTDLVAAGCSRLVLERVDSIAVHDERRIREARAKACGEHRLRFDHMRPHEEPMLWVADVVAWCWCRGGRWRADVGPVVTKVISL